MLKQKKLAILVGGGPAPGINSVISAATIRSTRVGVEVVGIQQGFEWIRKGDGSHTLPLTIENVESAHFLGGSILGISRANPTESQETLENTVQTLVQMGVDKLITIGGDGTAYCAMRTQQTAGDRLRVVHVPKTIDNDIALPPEIDTFGFQTARHVGVGIVKNLMTDAATSPRWYFVVSMGRKAGHLALGIGKAAGATLTLIPEEYPESTMPLDWLVDTLVCSIIKRRKQGYRHGVVVLAEGIIEQLDPNQLAELQAIERNSRGYVRLGEFNLAQAIKRAVHERLSSLGLDDVTLLTKDIGYELRCADPIPFDMEYCRDLGYCAAKYVISGGHSSMVSLQGGHFKPIPFTQLINAQDNCTQVRYVDLHSNRYRVAKRYMTRLRKDEVEDPQKMEEYGALVGLSGEEFKARFAYITQHELPSVPLPCE